MQCDLEKRNEPGYGLRSAWETRSRDIFPHFAPGRAMKQTMTRECRDEDQTIAFGRRLGALLRAGDTALLEGPLGAGKTRLAKGIVGRAAGVPEDDVVSPTFTLINSYESSPPVHHADLYRIDADQAESLGIADVVDEGGVLVVEWGAKARDLFDDPLTVVITFGEGDHGRWIRLEWDQEGSWESRIKGLDPDDRYR